MGLTRVVSICLVLYDSESLLGQRKIYDPELEGGEVKKSFYFNHFYLVTLNTYGKGQSKRFKCE